MNVSISTVIIAVQNTSKKTTTAQLGWKVVAMPQGHDQLADEELLFCSGALNAEQSWAPHAKCELLPLKKVLILSAGGPHSSRALTATILFCTPE